MSASCQLSPLYSSIPEYAVYGTAFCGNTAAFATGTQSGCERFSPICEWITGSETSQCALKSGVSARFEPFCKMNQNNYEGCLTYADYCDATYVAESYTGPAKCWPRYGKQLFAAYCSAAATQGDCEGAFSSPYCEWGSTAPTQDVGTAHCRPTLSAPAAYETLCNYYWDDEASCSRFVDYCQWSPGYTLSDWGAWSGECSHCYYDLSGVSEGRTRTCSGDCGSAPALSETNSCTAGRTPCPTYECTGLTTAVQSTAMKDGLCPTSSGGSDGGGFGNAGICLWSQLGPTNICLQDAYGYADAVTECTMAGARLCYADEYAAAASGTGCGNDAKKVWVQPTGGSDSYVMCNWTNGKRLTIQWNQNQAMSCETDTDPLSIRCCADHAAGSTTCDDSANGAQMNWVDWFNCLTGDAACNSAYLSLY